MHEATREKLYGGTTSAMSVPPGWELQDAEAIKTPIGFIPRYEDLKRLFKEVYDKDYSEKDYVKQFTLRVPENLAKIDRLMNIYRTRVRNTPQIIFKVLEEQKERLEKTREKLGDYIPPDKL